MATITDTIEKYPKLEVDFAQLKNRYYNIMEENEKLKSQLLNQIQTDNTNCDSSLNSEATTELQYDYSDVSGFPFQDNNRLTVPNNNNFLMDFQETEREWPSIGYRNYQELESNNRILNEEANKLKEEVKESERIYYEVMEQNKQLQTALNVTKLKNDNLNIDINKLTQSYEESQNKIIELDNILEMTYVENLQSNQIASNELLALENVKKDVTGNLELFQDKYNNLMSVQKNTEENLEKIVEFLRDRFSINNFINADDFISKIDSILKGNRNILNKNDQTIENLRFRVETLESNTVEKSIYEQLVNVLRDKFGLRSFVSVDDFIGQLNNIIDQNTKQLDNKDMIIEDLRIQINDLEMTTEEKDRKIQNIINKLANGFNTQIKNIDTEIDIYNNVESGFKSNPLKMDDFSKTYDYYVSPNIQIEYIPMLREISRHLHSRKDITDFDEIDKIDVNLYHSYMILISKLIELFSKEYISSYLDYIYKQCIIASESTTRILQLPKLILPQTFQINSLYYLMNRYNAKIYQPDRVLDFGDFLNNFLKPEFRPDETQALNLFQPGIGKRYNSILIYSEETIDILQNLKNKLRIERK